MVGWSHRYCRSTPGTCCRLGSGTQLECHAVLGCMGMARDGICWKKRLSQGRQKGKPGRCLDESNRFWTRGCYFLVFGHQSSTSKKSFFEYSEYGRDGRLECAKIWKVVGFQVGWFIFRFYGLCSSDWHFMSKAGSAFLAVSSWGKKAFRSL